MADINIQSFFTSVMSKIDNQAVNLNKELDALTADGKTVDPEDMLKMQFQIGQYNALLEATSSVFKSLTDEAKQLAQRAN